MNYKGYIVELESFGWTVCYCGDEIIFSTDKEAMNFIDEITN